jgi:hypothetical protein
MPATPHGDLMHPCIYTAQSKSPTNDEKSTSRQLETDTWLG